MCCQACKKQASLSDLVYGNHSVADVVEGNLPIPIHIQNVKRLLGFLRLQEMLQVLRQYVCPAEQQPYHVMQSDCEQLRLEVHGTVACSVSFPTKPAAQSVSARCMNMFHCYSTEQDNYPNISMTQRSSELNR